MADAATIRRAKQLLHQEVGEALSANIDVDFQLADLLLNPGIQMAQAILIESGDWAAQVTLEKNYWRRRFLRLALKLSSGAKATALQAVFDAVPIVTERDLGIF